MSSYVSAAPDLLTSAATDLAGIASSLSEANSAATAKTTAVIAAAKDEVSAAIARLFGAYGQQFQALSTQAAAAHTGFVQTLNATAHAYARTEDANTSATAAQLASWQASVRNSLDQAIQAVTPDLSVSISGRTLVHLGNATSGASTGSVAIAYGAHSSATASGVTDIACAVGTKSIATVSAGNENVAVVVAFRGDEDQAHAGEGERNWAAVFGGDFNSAKAFGFGNYAIVDGFDHGAYISAVALGHKSVSIQPQRVPLNLSISYNSHTYFESGSAYSSAATSDFALAYGPDSAASATGGWAIAAGNNDRAVANYGFGHVAFAFGTDNTATSQGFSPHTLDDFNVAGVLDGTGNTASVTSTGVGNIALVLSGNKLHADIPDGSGKIVIQPKLSP